MVAVFLLLPLADPAAADTCRVAEVPAGDTMVCGDGRFVRLAGLRAPKPAAWERGAAFTEASRDGLAQLLRGRSVTWETAVPDRHGRLRARVLRDDGLDVREEVLRRGLAMVETQPECRDGAEGLLRLEMAARTAGRGLWALSRYRVQPAQSVQPHGWRIVEGQVQAIARRGSVVYVNFGQDWRTDFTLRLTGAVLDAVDADSLPGRRLRVRGWVGWRSGPQMEPDHAESIEILE